jgi:hypothetical protein
MVDLGLRLFLVLYCAFLTLFIETDSVVTG